MTEALKTLFEINPALDLAPYAARFAATGRVQLRNVLTEQSARELMTALARGTPWGMAVGAVSEINNPPRKIAPIAAGDKVVFKKASLGYYFIRINGQIGVKGRRVS